MSRFCMRAAAAGLLTIVLPAAPALAHAVCGNRVFPPTLVMDDPGMNDEASLPTIQYTPNPASGGTPAGSTTLGASSGTRPSLARRPTPSASPSTAITSRDAAPARISTGGTT